MSIKLDNSESHFYIADPFYIQDSIWDAWWEEWASTIPEAMVETEKKYARRGKEKKP